MQEPKFKLLIECSKDIDKLKIDFTDGSSVVKETQPNTPTQHNKRKKIKNKTPKSDNLIDTDVDYDDYQQEEVVQLPQIPDLHREVKVAEELQNLDI